MKIAIANDHAAVQMKEVVTAELKNLGHEILNFGTDTEESCDYPDFAIPACEAVVNGEADLAILICGTGIGMSLAANKVKGIRCCACSETFSAEMSRRHNNANALAFGARVVGEEIAKRLVSTFVSTDFEGGRHERRVKKIMDLE
ncbi:MAG: ribose 5-phosphate isomerase B [Eubacteriales bacterium]|nr:ribose 5-phosphate isomerase B [Eubacteriales bacterium]